jgi:hypothetical protein
MTLAILRARVGTALPLTSLILPMMAASTQVLVAEQQEEQEDY